MKKVLIVDDSFFTRSIHQRIVASAGYETILASSGSEALKAYALEKPDVVMMDLLMPDMDGMEVIQKILGMNPQARTIVCSTDKQKYRREEAAAIGAIGFISKPVDSDELTTVLRQSLEDNG
jgi:two-component system chemotaxis response regulator CheY